MDPVVILGCGFTGQRLARRLLQEERAVICTTRDASGLGGLAQKGARIVEMDLSRDREAAILKDLVPDGSTVVHSVPLIRFDGETHDPTPEMLAAIGTKPRRMIYLSTSGVYGKQSWVDEHTQPAPVLERQVLRVHAEQAVARGKWESLILRPAGIYGPGRGVHVSMRDGRHKLLGDGSNFHSRIHVDDLVQIVHSAIDSDLRGAFPVADEHPCPAMEIAQFCADLLGLSLPPSVGAGDISETLRFDRRIDARAIRRHLNVTLRYPSYRQGIPACLEEESRP